MIDFFVEDVRQVFIFDASGKFYLEKITFVIEGNYKKSRVGDDGRGFRIQLTEVLLSPLDSGL